MPLRQQHLLNQCAQTCTCTVCAVSLSHVYVSLFIQIIDPWMKKKIITLICHLVEFHDHCMKLRQVDEFMLKVSGPQEGPQVPDGPDKPTPCFTLHSSNCVSMSQSWLWHSRYCRWKTHPLLFPSHLHHGGSQVLTLSLFDCLRSTSCVLMRGGTSSRTPPRKAAAST